MWDDADVEEETQVAPEPTAEEAPAEPEGQGAAVEEEVPVESLVKGTEAKKLIFRHWVRPKFLQYNYLYNYRHNYYDDVINYMDRRNRGLWVETPRAQTWGERALRSYLANTSSNYSAKSSNRDTSLLRSISSGARFQRYHIKSMISRKYSTLGFNTVSI